MFVNGWVKTGSAPPPLQMYQPTPFFSRDTKKIHHFLPGGLDGYTSDIGPKVSGSIPGHGTFFKSWSI